MPVAVEVVVTVPPPGALMVAMPLANAAKLDDYCYTESKHTEAEKCMETQTFRTGIFVSYSHVDRDWLTRLRTHLAPYTAGEKLRVWDDTQISAGSNWESEIESAIARSRVAVLLVTPEFLASHYVMTVELPALLRRVGSDITIFWVAIRPSAFEVTPVAKFQAANDPAHPLALMSLAEQDQALVSITKQIAAAIDANAVGNAFRIIDAFEPQVAAFLQGQPDPEKPPQHSAHAQQVDGAIHLVQPQGSRILITATDFEKFDANAQKLIRAYERTMKELFERWTELKPKRIAQDRETRREACEESDGVRRELCAELNGLLRFIESMGMHLTDHYNHVRHICASSTS